MTNRFQRMCRTLVLAIAMGSAALMSVNSALADKMHLKDGRVLEGKVVREGQGFVFFRVKTGTVERDEMFTTSQILKIERDDATPKTDENIAKQDEKKPDPAKTEPKHTGATRIAVLNFGPPSSWNGQVDSMVGREISVETFRKAVPLLEKAKVDVVVVRVNSGGGLSIEMPKFQELFEKTYKPKFRTVGWIESAISAAAMSPWVLEEYVFFPQGSMGACTEFNMGNMKASDGPKLEMVLYEMEKASALGKKDPRIMRAMQIEEPLSVDFDKETGEVIWRQDENGEMLLNPKHQVFTITASQAVKTKFAKGIASTIDEVAKALSINEYEVVALDATELVDKSMRENDTAFKRFNELFEKYALARNLAGQLPDKERRGQMIADARRRLAELKRAVGLNPNFKLFVGIEDEWFTEQEELLRNLAKGP